MAETYLLRGARQLLTLRGPRAPRRGLALADLSIILDGALLIRDGIIEEVGLTRRVENLAAARKAKIIDVTGKVVMPSFVDSGVSLVSAHSPVERAYQCFSGGAPQTAADQNEDILDGARAMKLFSKKGLILRNKAFTASMARHGTGTAGVITGYGLDETGEVKMLRAMEALNGPHLELHRTFFAAGAIPPDYKESAGVYMHTVMIPMLKMIARRKLARFAAVRCGPLAFDFDSALAYLNAARAAGLSPVIYSQQFARDDSIRLALETKAISITHLEQLRGWDVDLLANSRTIAVLAPASTFLRALPRFAPAREFIDRGGAVALATAFNPGGCPTFSMPFVISLACRYLGMSAAEAICASTINAAFAQEVGGATGSFESGKQADLIVLNMRDYRELPLQPGVNIVHMVMKRGRIVHEEGTVGPC